jgi:transcriptional regulator with XRE-family HTH domain
MSKLFGRAVRSLRERSGLSQEALAAKAGIHRTYVSSVELGKVRLGLDVAKKLAVALGLALSEVVALAESGKVSRKKKKQSE